MTDEMFPPSEAELEQIIKALRAQLEDPALQDEWVRINTELLRREEQLKTMIIQNNAL